jgi:hypothetical protein
MVGKITVSCGPDVAQLVYLGHLSASMSPSRQPERRDHAEHRSSPTMRNRIESWREYGIDRGAHKDDGDHGLHDLVELRHSDSGTREDPDEPFRLGYSPSPGRRPEWR